MTAMMRRRVSAARFRVYFVLKRPNAVRIDDRRCELSEGKTRIDGGGEHNRRLLVRLLLLLSNELGTY